MVKVVHFCPPYVGGTYTGAAMLHSGLRRHGYDLSCVGVEPGESGGEVHARQLEEGVEMWRVSADLCEATCQIIRHMASGNYRVVMVLALEEVLTANLIHYLPKSFSAIVKTPMMSHAVYSRARHMAPYADRVIAVSDRVAADLVRRYHLPAEKVVSIFNGVDLERFSAGLRQPPQPGPLRAIYLGRIADLDKGVFFLPKIMREVRNQRQQVILDVVGEGGDLARLRSQIETAGLQGMVRLLGPKPLGEVPALLRGYDCLVMPSRMEACGWSLLEGMAAGCVPVVHDIWGSMGSIVQDGVSGFTIPVGDTRRFAQCLVQLSHDHQLLHRMSCAALDRAQRFSSQQMAAQYAQVFSQALAGPGSRRSPLALDRYRVPAVMGRTWRSHLPRPVKTLARKWMVRLGMPA